MSEDHHGWIFHNPDTGMEWSEDHPIDSGEVPDAEAVQAATAGVLHAYLMDAWSRIYDLEAELQEDTPPADVAAQEQIARYRMALERIVAGPGPSCDSPEQQAQWDCSVARAALHPTQGGK
jgi:hypothetical protein